MIYTTTDTIDGKIIYSYLGVVTGDAKIMSTNPAIDNSYCYSECSDKAKAKMGKMAGDLGANAVIGIHYEISRSKDDEKFYSYTLTMSGTAVKAIKFTSAKIQVERDERIALFTCPHCGQRTRSTIPSGKPIDSLIVTCRTCTQKFKLRPASILEIGQLEILEKQAKLSSREEQFYDEQEFLARAQLIELAKDRMRADNPTRAGSSSFFKRGLWSDDPDEQDKVLDELGLL